MKLRARIIEDGVYGNVAYRCGDIFEITSNSTVGGIVDCVDENDDEFLLYYKCHDEIDECELINEDGDVVTRDGELLSDSKQLTGYPVEDIVNQPSHYTMGEIETRVYIKDVLTNNKNLDAYEGYLLGTALKYLSTRLGNKATVLEDTQKAMNYLKELEEYQATKEEDNGLDTDI